MAGKPVEHLKISEIASCAEEDDLILWFGQFLDDFRHEDRAGKIRLIKEEPIWTRSDNEDMYWTLAATAHKLANDNGIPVPEWCMDKKYVAPEAIYGLHTQIPEYQKLLRETSPREFAMRNLFFGDNVLSRA